MVSQRLEVTERKTYLDTPPSLGDAELSVDGDKLEEMRNLDDRRSAAGVEEGLALASLLDPTQHFALELQWTY